jgi:hypothetical protein
MTRHEQERIVRELCQTYQRRLLRNIEQFPESWDGRHIRALFAHLTRDELTHPGVKRAEREMRKSMHWYALPL